MPLEHCAGGSVQYLTDREVRLLWDRDIVTPSLVLSPPVDPQTVRIIKILAYPVVKLARLTQTELSRYDAGTWRTIMGVEINGKCRPPFFAQ
jgi:hypothetical protein